jgi:hypothetical protein
MSKPDLEKTTDKFGKLTMKQPYTKTRFLSVQARGALDLLRPFTLLAPLIVSMAIMVASLVFNFTRNPSSLPDNIADNWWITIGQASLTIAIINAASNCLNQATDVESDKISKPYRPIPQGIIRADSAQSLAYILYLFALLKAEIIDRKWFDLYDSKHYSVENKLINYNKSQIKQIQNKDDWRNDYILREMIEQYGNED